MLKGLRMLLFFLMVILSVTLIACSQQSSNPDSENENEKSNQDSISEEQPKILKVADTATVTTWDPSIAFSTEVAYLSNIYEPLLWANPVGSGEAFSPGLAETWESDDEGLEWTFNIRQGVSFHDGAALNAEAVKKSIERTINIGKGAAFIWSPVEKIEVVDEYVIKFTLSYPVPFERIVSSGNGAWIMSPNVIDKDEAWFNQGAEAGTGPWKLEKYEPGQEIVLIKNEEYWGEWNTTYEMVHISIVSEGVVQQQMLTSGEVDIATSVPLENIKNLEGDSNIKVIREQSFYNFVGFFNTKKPPLDNKLVRQALSYAVPYEDIIQVATFGAGTQARGPVPQGLWPYDESVKQYEYNIEKAKALLDEAGVNPEDLHLKLTYAAENDKEERFAPLIKEGFAKLGVDLEVQPVLWNQQWAKAKGNPKDAQDIFVLMWWPTYADGYDNLKNLFTTEEEPAWNLAYWYNKKYDQLLEDAYALSGSQKDQSKNLYLQAQEMLTDEAPALYFFDMQRVVPVRSNLSGDATNMNYPSVIFYHNLKVK